MKTPGSSPRVRGTLVSPHHGIQRIRFIPAGAGNTCRRRRRNAAATVHPRGCGEHGVRRPGGPHRGGSSPRVRGTHVPKLVAAGRVRFIPAGAGNTVCTRTSIPACPVHPRGCGEHMPLPAETNRRTGSSPRVRGTRWHRQAHQSLRRFIPAGAGNTRPGARTRTRPAVHPRGCGEHRITAQLELRAGGSSPRVRGTLSPARVESRGRRFIPAGAGNTCRHMFQTQLHSVHPRGCGEHPKQWDGHNETPGSSPRVRGTLSTGMHVKRRRRFIPAGAGNTT